MSIQRTDTFHTYGIKPSFNDMVKARPKTLQNPVPNYCLLENDVEDIIYTWSLTIF